MFHHHALFPPIFTAISLSRRVPHETRSEQALVCLGTRRDLLLRYISLPCFAQKLGEHALFFALVFA